MNSLQNSSEEGIKVLIVDDEPSIRDLLTRHLRFEGFRTHAVGNGHDAVDAAEKGEPDIILLDVMLPDMSGFRCLLYTSDAADDRIRV
jgi:two-component system OmpR family response regulator